MEEENIVKFNGIKLMNIYAPSGTKIRCIKRLPESPLWIGEIYTIDHTEVRSCDTSVFLKEFI